MANEYAIYDMKDYEQCVYIGTLKEIAKFLEYSENGLRSYLSHKKAGRRDSLIHKQYELIEIEENKEIDIEKENNSRKAFKELLELFQRPKIEFPIFDEYKWKIKGIKDKVIIDEEWKKIDGTYYSISNYGRVINDNTKTIKTPKNKKGCMYINLCNNGKSFTVSVSRLVATFFLQTLKDNERVRHIDGDIRNNYYKNLEIVSK